MMEFTVIAALVVIVCQMERVIRRHDRIAMNADLRSGTIQELGKTLERIEGLARRATTAEVLVPDHPEWEVEG
jgi:hypothetical protein